MAGLFITHPSYLAKPITQPNSIPELYDWHEQNNGDHPLYVYEDAPERRRIITMGEAAQAFQRATGFMIDHADGKAEDGRCAVAILASSETIAYISIVIGILRAGYVACPISIRNNEQAIAHLLSSASVAYAIVSSEPDVRRKYQASISLLRERIPEPKLIEMPTFERFFPGQGYDPSFEYVPMAKIDIDSTACIYHTSGTTGNPEPIRLTHRALYCFSTVPTHSEINLTGLIYGCHSIPIYHGMGWMPMTFPTSVGLTISVFKPRFPPTDSTPDNVIREALSVNTNIILCAPVLPEYWSQYPHYVEHLAKMKGVIVGGAPLTRLTGDALATAGVNIICQYGTTQTALLSKFIPEPDRMDWEYFKFSSGWTIRLKDYGGGFVEPIVLDSDAFKPYVFNSTFEGMPAYSTGDLLMAHPNFPDRFRIVGRTDEQIRHPDGRTTNPTPMEHMFNKDVHVECAIVFGDGQAQCGVLIQPRVEFAFDPSDANKMESFRNALWPTVEKVNNMVPEHARISKGMILVASPEKPFQYTLKQTLRRQVMIDEYAKEIEQHYAHQAKYP